MQLNGENLKMQSDSEISIRSHNEVHVKIESDRGIAQEISDHFSFYVPGYRFMPAFKSRSWDGKIRLFDLNKLIIYKGLINEVKKFANSRKYKDYGEIKDIQLLYDEKNKYMITVRLTKIEADEWKVLEVYAGL